MPAETEKPRHGQPTIAPAGANVARISGAQLTITLGKEVVIRVSGVEQSLRGKVVGYDADAYIMVCLVLPEDVRGRLEFGVQAVLKYVHKGEVYGFRTLLREVITSPAPMVFFSYPDIIEKMEIGRASRQSIRLDGMLSSGEEGQGCTLVNISETGCRISANHDSPLSAVKVGDIRTVEMVLDDSGPMKVAVAVCNSSRIKGSVHLGLMFLDLYEGAEARIQYFLAEIARSTR